MLIQEQLTTSMLYAVMPACLACWHLPSMLGQYAVLYGSINQNCWIEFNRILPGFVYLSFHTGVLTEIIIQSKVFQSYFTILTLSSISSSNYLIFLSIYLSNIYPIFIYLSIYFYPIFIYLSIYFYPVSLINLKLLTARHQFRKEESINILNVLFFLY